MGNLLTPPLEAMIYEDEKIYVCLASYPLTKGHTVVVWKDKVEDLHSLARNDYQYLMEMVDISRNMLMEEFKVEKVYLLYLDEIKHVHWHLVPRYNEQGFNILNHTPEKTENFSLNEKLKAIFFKNRAKYQKTEG